MQTTNAYWVEVNGKMVTRTGAQLVEMYRFEYERNQHARVAGLQKGHATLTRRVQELESALKAAENELIEYRRLYPSIFSITNDGFSIKEKGIERVRLGKLEQPFMVAGGDVFIDESLIQEAGISKADTQLQADIEHLSQRVSALENVRKTAASAQDIGDAVHAFVEQYIDKQKRIGGSLNRGR